MQRKLKKKGVDLLSFFGNNDYENRFKEFVSMLISKIELSAIYQTYPINDAIEIIKSREFNPDEKTEYTTISILTAGSKIDEFMNLKDDIEKNISETIIDVYLTTARNTVIEIIDEEAKKDNYIITKPFFIYSPFDVDNTIIYEGDLSHLLKEIDSKKISIELSDLKIQPYFTEIFFLNWIYKKTKR